MLSKIGNKVRKLFSKAEAPKDETSAFARDAVTHAVEAVKNVGYTFFHALKASVCTGYFILNAISIDGSTNNSNNDNAAVQAITSVKNALVSGVKAVYHAAFAVTELTVATVDVAASVVEKYLDSNTSDESVAPSETLAIEDKTTDKATKTSGLDDTDIDEDTPEVILEAVENVAEVQEAIEAIGEVAAAA